jgi:hypothetical protein
VPPVDDGGCRERRHVAAYVVEACAVNGATAVRIRRVRVAAPAPVPQRPVDDAGVVADVLFGLPVLGEFGGRVLQAVDAQWQLAGVAGTAKRLDGGGGWPSRRRAGTRTPRAGIVVGPAGRWSQAPRSSPGSGAARGPSASLNRRAQRRGVARLAAQGRCDDSRAGLAGTRHRCPLRVHGVLDRPGRCVVGSLLDPRTFFLTEPVERLRVREQGLTRPTASRSAPRATSRRSVSPTGGRAS